MVGVGEDGESEQCEGVDVRGGKWGCARVVIPDSVSLLSAPSGSVHTPEYQRSKPGPLHAATFPRDAVYQSTWMVHGRLDGHLSDKTGLSSTHIYILL